MGVWGKIGKIALKAAPYAAMAIPGVGIPLGMAIAGGTAAASKKLEGGSWKQAALAGGIGAGTSAVGAGALKGIGPSSSGLSKFLGGAAGKTAGTGAQGVAGRVVGNAALGKLTGGTTTDLGKYGYGNTSIISDDPRTGGIAGNTPRSGGIGSTIGDIMTRYATDRMAAGGGGGRTGTPVSNSPTGRPNTQNFPGAGESMGGQTGNYQGIMRGLGPVMGRRDQNVPNFAESIGAGRQDAIRNQPFRQGYDMLMRGPEPADDSQGNIGPMIHNAMPPIYPNFASSGRRRQYAGQ